MNKVGLILIPTPIDETSKLNPESFDALLEASTNPNAIIAVEDLKPARRRWIQFGLPREAIDRFIQLNEHTTKLETENLLCELKNGKAVYLMSDGGLPAFCDPGRELVYLCHKNNIKVTSGPFFNSVILALALSGFKHDEFYFHGFLPLKDEDRDLKIKKILDSKVTSILMDTPYRLKKVMSEFLKYKNQYKFKELFLAQNLNTDNENLTLFNLASLKEGTEFGKVEFILIVSPD